MPTPRQSGGSDSGLSAKRAAEPKSSDAKAGATTPDNAAAEPRPAASSATGDTAPVQPVPSAGVAQPASVPPAAFAANNLVHNNNSSPTSAQNSILTASAPTPASSAAATGDTASNATRGMSVESSSAATAQTAADKKSAAPAQSNITPTHVASEAVPAAPQPSPPLVRSAAAPDLPKTHQIIDTAPPAPPMPPPASGPPDPTAAVQMHVGIRTEAFGAIDIHTVVQQSHVGITVHADRDLAHWFSSEVPGLESGLNKSHLNLTAVDFDNGHSSAQTASGFQNGQPRQNSSQTPNSQSAALPSQGLAPDSATVDTQPSDLSVRPAPSRVSILV